jgi:hypothetical protein
MNGTIPSLLIRLTVLEKRLSAENFADEDAFLVKISLQDLKQIIAAVQFMSQRATEALLDSKKTLFGRLGGFFGSFGRRRS